METNDVMSDEKTLNSELTAAEFRTLIDSINNSEMRKYYELKLLFEGLKITTHPHLSPYQIAPRDVDYFIIINGDTIIDVLVSLNTIDTLVGLKCSDLKRMVIFNALHINMEKTLPNFTYIRVVEKSNK